MNENTKFLMGMDANTLTAIIAICAIVSPILVALINNYHQTKMKKLEISEIRYERQIEYLQSIYQSYLQSASAAIASPRNETLSEYGKNYAIAFSFFPPKAHDRLKQINQSIYNKDWKAAEMQLEELSLWLSDLIKDIWQS